MQIVITKDEKGYLTEAKDYPNIFAWGETKTEAKREFGNVLEMIVDYYLEQTEKEALKNASAQTK